MTDILAYSDRWSVTPSQEIRFMVSTKDGTKYKSQLFRLLQPDAGPNASAFTPEAIDAACNGEFVGHYQRLPCGSFAIAPKHNATKLASDLTIASYVQPTRIEAGRQALVGTWCEHTQNGFGLEINDGGRLAFRYSSQAGEAMTVCLDEPMRNGEWYLVAVVIDVRNQTIKLAQEPLASGFADLQRPATITKPAREPSADADMITFAAWKAGPTEGPAAWNGLDFTCFFNGKIDRPRIISKALDRSGIATLLSDPLTLEGDDAFVAAWDFSTAISSDDIVDIGQRRLNGVIVNQPARGVTGFNWDGTSFDWTRSRSQYGAIHFHDDDLIDACWQSAFGWRVPLNTRSGVYGLKLTSGDTVFWVPFVVRPKPGTGNSKIVFLVSTATYLAYLNHRGRMLSISPELYHGRLNTLDSTDCLLIETPEMGLSTYDVHSDGSGVFYSSRLRPASNFRPNGRLWNFSIDLLIIDWLEALGEDYDVITDEDLHHEGATILDSYQVLITGSHPEYCSLSMLDAIREFMARGGRLMYMGGNGFYWRIAFHPTRAGLLEVRRAEDGVRAWESRPGEYHLGFTGEYGGLWRRLGRPPQLIAGVGFVSQGFDCSSYYVPTNEAGDPRIAWAFAGVRSKMIGDYGLLYGGAAGIEIDSANSDLGTPSHALVIARSERHSNTYELAGEEVLVPSGATDGLINKRIHADMTFFETNAGGAVFSTGSIAYAGSLCWNGFDNDISRLTTNILVRFKDIEPFRNPLGE